MLWLQQQAQFAKLVRLQPRGRVATLDSETLLKDPIGTLVAANALFGLDVASNVLNEVATGPVFTSHSKRLGETFDAPRRSADLAKSEAAYGEEIGMVIAWAEQVAAHVGVPMKLGARFSAKTICRGRRNARAGSAGRIRTYDQPVNSRLLYH